MMSEAPTVATVAPGIGRALWFLRRMSKAGAPRKSLVLGRSYEIASGVFSPAFSRATEFFAREVARYCDSGSTLFEVGCGSGVVSVHCAAERGARVTCTDINKAAVECAVANARMHHVQDRVKVIHDRGFDDVRRRFDVVFFALPYVRVDDVSKYVAEFGPLAYSVFDERFSSQKEYLQQAPSFSKSNGTILVGFGDVGGIDDFLANVAEAGATPSLVAREGEGRADNRLYVLEY